MPATSPNTVKKISITDGEIVLNEHDIIECIPVQDAELTVAKLLESMEAIEKLAAGKRMCIMVVTNTRNTMSKEARELDIADRKRKYTLAQAMVVNSMSTLLIANFYIRFKNFPFPYRVFKSRDKAIEWLRQKRLEAGEV